MILDAVNLNGATVRLVLEDGRIAAIEPMPGPATQTAIPLPVEPHVHLDKAFTIHRARADRLGLFGAIEAMAADKARWTPLDLLTRIEDGMAEAWAAGCRAVRTHIDWTEPAVPLAWEVAAEVAEEWADRMMLVRASLSPIDLLGDPGHGPKIAERVARDGQVLGAFIYRHPGLEDGIPFVFDLAERHDLWLDFHVDEGLEVEAAALDLITAEATRRGMGDRVLCGHACSLSIRSDADRAIDALAASGVALTVMPTTNLYLQDMTPGRSPRLRGLAPAQELRAAGVPVLLGTDNVRDPFYPMGVHDPLESLRLAALAAHLDPAEWLGAITEAPARALGLAPQPLAVGEPADFLLFPAPDLLSALARPGVPRQVWRAGCPHAEGVAP
ncbi:amidohydrolase family protein [Tabrizicola caldifontis]|uniref:amidohydrolase family protein n=1 Tax=Tabrizicola caldifontis TaxID=2528036 RepID=UPI00108218D0|nr:amidohydrolase family protein [Rhodobacter sp. YIM 73028]